MRRRARYTSGQADDILNAINFTLEGIPPAQVNKALVFEMVRLALSMVFVGFAMTKDLRAKDDKAKPTKTTTWMKLRKYIKTALGKGTAADCIKSSVPLV